MMLVPPKMSPGHKLVLTPEDMATMVNELREAREIAFDFETSGLRYWDGQKPIGIALGYLQRGAPRAWYIPVAHRTAEPQANPQQARQAVADAFRAAESLLGHNLKFDLNMARADGWEVPLWTPIHDTMIQAYLIDEARSVQLEKLVMQLGVSPYGDALQMKDAVEGWIRDRAKSLRLSRGAYLDKHGHEEVPVALESEYACRDIGHTLVLDRTQREKAQGVGQVWESERQSLYENEMLLVRALADMEYVGQRVDTQYLERVKVQINNELDEVGRELSRHFGDNRAWNNDRVIRELVYEELKFPVMKVTKRGGQPAVDKAALFEMVSRHPGIEPLIEWRARYKILTTYTDSLISKADANGRVHPSFNQGGAASGRLSSSKPNFQNIPARHPILSKLVRKAFVVDPGKARIYCDYSQIELRMLAWITQNQTLLSAYQSDAYEQLCWEHIDYSAYRQLRTQEESSDVHALVAQRVFGATIGDSDWKRKRSAAKIINFGVPYGGGPNLLMGNAELRMPEKQARAYHRAYHQTNPEIDKTKNRLLAKMRKHPDLLFRNWTSRARHGKRLNWTEEALVAEEERSMFACLVQGSAAELTRYSIVRLWLLQQRGELAGVTTSTVHDEIQVDCEKQDIEEVALIVQREMEAFTGLFGSVPVIADLETTITNWADKKEWTL
tara:strand:+ start:1232 stop:3247 length:2016 start_codon:yes stop_codon:yes gene_type:complete